MSTTSRLSGSSFSLSSLSALASLLCKSFLSPVAFKPLAL
eukprot:CAMPEP_0182482284 /NCGR_PEP_ID=MMETSP1319-20130603/38977_1 /TAXON_ID=172717 /ORGANISM="Bolidomonas pacifica, Strain RCC208" /LENGTH=39 /DNA_ID= /DNA_START= /DNA_END= /DNA_ORIENTATION=